MIRTRRSASVSMVVVSAVLGAITGWFAMRRCGLGGLARRNVSPRGGNVLLFVGMKALIWTIFRVLGPLDVKGQQNIPVTGGMLIAPNHLSNSDVHALYVALPRWAWYVGTVEIFDIPIMGPLIRYYHAFPIRREGPPDKGAMKRILDLLGEGEAVVLFPEGHEAEDLMLQDFEPGAAMLAMRAGVPIIPTAIVGTERIAPYGTSFPRYSGKPVHIRFGPPVDLSGLPDGDRHKRLAEATKRIHHDVAELLRELAPERIPPAER